jgi:hypothetical protein
LDELNPTQQEWCVLWMPVAAQPVKLLIFSCCRSIFAIRNLTENCAENQEVIAALQRQNPQSFA